MNMTVEELLEMYKEGEAFGIYYLKEEDLIYCGVDTSQVDPRLMSSKVHSFECANNGTLIINIAKINEEEGY